MGDRPATSALCYASIFCCGMHVYCRNNDLCCCRAFEQVWLVEVRPFADPLVGMHGRGGCAVAILTLRASCYALPCAAVQCCTAQGLLRRC